MSIVDGGNAFSTYPEVIPGTAIGYSPVTRTVGDVFKIVKRQFGDESAVQLEDSDIVAWINMAQDAIVAKNKVLKSKSSLAANPNQSEYTLPDLGIHQIESLHYNGARLPNVPFSQAEERIISQGADLIQGPPMFWYEWGGKFTLWPAPDTSAKIDVYYTARPSRVDGVASTPLGVPDKYFDAITSYVLQKAYEMDEDWNASNTKGQQFTETINEMGEEERTAQNMTYEVIGVVDMFD